MTWVVLLACNLLLNLKLYSLSVYLYDATRNDTYLNAARSLQMFIQAHLYNKTHGYVMDGMRPDTCTPSGPIVTYDTALYLEGISVLANLTKNATLTEMLVFRSHTDEFT